VDTGLTIGAFATENTLSTLSLKVPSLGQAAMTASIPVSLSNDHPDVKVRASTSTISSVSAELTTSNSVEALSATPANQSRRYLFLQNISTAAIYVNFTSAATTTSMRLDAGASLSFEGNFVPNNSVNLLRSGTANQRYFLLHATY
jgi:hypothetical protein